MSSLDMAREIRKCLPETENIVVDYLSDYLVDDAGADEDVLQVTRNMLESFAESNPTALDELLKGLETLLSAHLNSRESVGGPRKLEKALEMGKTGAISNTISFTEGVDLESINKTKFVLQLSYSKILLTSIS